MVHHGQQENHLSQNTTVTNANGGYLRGRSFSGEQRIENIIQQIKLLFYVLGSGHNHEHETVNDKQLCKL